MTNECGNSRIAGCQLTLFPMSDDFVDVILSALDETDTSKVWKDTDDVSTCIRGKMVHVFDVAHAIYLHAAKTGKHVAMSGTFSIGCPGDTAGHVYMDETDEPMNKKQSEGIDQEAGCKFALYPMGTEEYMEKITEQIDLSNERGVTVTPTHYATRLDGQVNDIFRAMEEAFDKVQQVVSHVTMTFTISANSPSNR
ncbi:Ykof family thiamine-binding protein [Allobacillus sp. GCM10007491]|uniref:Ykof family thiamine-binding protein n=1 Tax=Allobacillus saliphilus TaxID=2912308 RepID=A0A941CWG8_9BACI|nr:Ykof family thiamine-binding protein [Allobacillus saliphilus]MBR7553925.1 Ykof family thiamine-binding protein [Allobacillus saliphilus]